VVGLQKGKGSERGAARTKPLKANGHKGGGRNAKKLQGVSNRLEMGQRLGVREKGSNGKIRRRGSVRKKGKKFESIGSQMGCCVGMRSGTTIVKRKDPGSV